ncbi:MAG: hypothetical protein H0W75_00710 [Chitinophagaceae bacterium]|nr:hypothetical protein [Chitinophagaceae bacterium]
MKIILLKSFFEDLTSLELLAYVSLLGLFLVGIYFFYRFVFDIDKRVELQEEQNELLKQVIEKLNK